MEHLNIKTLNVNQWIDAPERTANFGDVVIVEKNTSSGASGVWIEVITDKGKFTILTTGTIIKMLGQIVEGKEQFWKENPTENLS